MSNWNIVCNSNIYHIQKYGYDILFNNIYIYIKLGLLKGELKHSCNIPYT